ncbi:unnamed protein product [Hermetia illucens]|uniref:Uncharacterized protein n=1 Tax=Hermetia illucens TaxID=343691 RepID=A0A7R8UF58_HERIL|nr:unnamed protein product [Hermetia illucens]
MYLRRSKLIIQITRDQFLRKAPEPGRERITQDEYLVKVSTFCFWHQDNQRLEYAAVHLPRKELRLLFKNVM